MAKAKRAASKKKSKKDPFLGKFMVVEGYDLNKLAETEKEACDQFFPRGAEVYDGDNVYILKVIKKIRVSVAVEEVASA